jgi:hypothetical protein
MSNTVRAGLVGGAAMFVLGLLTSLAVNYMPESAARVGGCCNCLWIIAGGAIAAKVYVGKSPTTVQPGEGAVAGAVAGIVGGVLNFAVTAGVYLFFPDRVNAAFAQIEAAVKQAGANVPSGLLGWPVIILIGVLGFVVDVILGTVGGLIGVSLFEKRRGGAQPPTPPPPPPDFGGFGQGT